jgi:branched-chain amino acid transport system ATP-binding protein
VAARLGLTDVLGELPAALPFGTLRAVDVGMALAARPRLLLLDEPAAGMDAADAIALCELLVNLRNDLGLAVVLVEHDMGVVGRVAERVIVLDRGRIIAEGPPAAIAADPIVVASYLGTTAARLAEVAHA